MQSSQHGVFEKVVLNEQQTNTFKLKMNILYVTLVHRSDKTHATCINFPQDWLFLTKYSLSLSTQLMPLASRMLSINTYRAWELKT